jgi:multiple sugar transport system ATP-binding protein
MRDGHVCQVDTPANVYDRPRDTFVAGFLGSPPMNLLAGELVSHDGIWSARVGESPGTRLDLPPALAAAAARARASAVIVGLRPEHLSATPAEGTDATEGTLPATLELAEPLGHQLLLHLRVGSTAITVRSEPGARPALGSLMRVRGQLDRLHLFDAATGVSLMSDGA